MESWQRQGSHTVSWARNKDERREIHDLTTELRDRDVAYLSPPRSKNDTTTLTGAVAPSC